MPPKDKAAWRAANRERLREADRKYRAAHPEVQKAWVAAHAEELASRQRAKRQADPELVRAKDRAYRKEHPSEQGRQRLHNHGLDRETLAALHAHQDGRCAICGVPGPAKGDGCLEIDHDHVTGERRGLLCRKCNVGVAHLERARGTGTPEWAARARAYLVDPPLAALRRSA